MLNLSDIKDELRKRTGIREISLEDDKLVSFLRARISQQKLRTAHDYIHFLNSDSTAAGDEMRLLVGLISNTESFFFRDHGQMDLLRNRILPELIACKQPGERLRVLSAACSTGEELYSVCIMLHELAPKSEVVFDLIGVDINQEALKKAEEGLYSPWSFRGVPNTIMEKYFTMERGKLRLSKEIRQMASFRYYNLVEGVAAFPAAARNEKFDLIICRNVFIYFDDEAIQKSVTGLLALLREGGYLLTGHSELANRHFPDLHTVHFPESFIGRKTDGKPPKPKQTQVIQEVKPAVEPPATKARRTPITRIRLEPETVAPEMPGIPGTSDTISLLNQARLEADTGNTGNAKMICDQVIEKEPFNHLAYFTLGQIANEEGEIEEAIILFNKVIYLESRFYPAYLELATIQSYLGNGKIAEKYRQNAVSILKMLDPGTPAELHSGMTAGDLLAEISSKIHKPIH